MKRRLHPYAFMAAARERLGALFHRTKVEREFDEEMRFHLDMEIEKNVRAGMTPDEARRAAVMAFGGVDRMVESHRDARGTRMFEDAVADIRYAMRALARTPGFVAVSVFTVAISIGIGTALFTAANAFIYRPLPVPDGERLVVVYTSDYNGREYRGSSSYADLVDFARDAEPVADLAGQARVQFALTIGDDVRLTTGSIVSSNYFRVMRIAPAVGRFPAADKPESPAIVLSFSLWRKAFHSDSSVIGRSMRVNGQPFVIAAVAPPEFRGTSRENADEFWIDATFSALVSPQYDFVHRRGNRAFHLYGRLRDGATLEALNARLDVSASRLFLADPVAWRDARGVSRAVTAMYEPDGNVAGIAPADLAGILGGVIALGFGLLAIACANLASMQLARGAARRREIATRLALGASRGRLIRQLLAECALVAVPGAVLGVLLAVVVSVFVSHYRPIPLPSIDLSIDWRVASFIASGLMLALLVFGLLPALQTVKADVVTDLKAGSGGTGGVRVGGMRGALIVVQVALSVVFTASSGLIALALLRNASQGREEARQVLTARVDFLPASGDSAHVRSVVKDLIAGVGAIPGVVAASAAEFIPVRGTRRTVMAETRDAAGQPKSRELDVTAVAPRYFDVVGIRLVRGRDFESRDIGVGYRSVIVSKAMAEALWPAEDAIGKRMTINNTVRAEVIGVMVDPPGQGPATDHSYPGLLYLPMNLTSEAEVILHLRAPSGQAAIAEQVAHMLRRENTRLAAAEVMTLDEYFNRQALPQRIMAQVSAVLAALQLLLAIAGLSGLVAYVTTLRRREIGIRVALGASRRSVMGLVMRQGVRLTMIGGVIGLLASLAVGQVVAAVMPVTVPSVVGGLLIAAGIFAAVAITAMMLPARRALGVSPAAALRVD